MKKAKFKLILPLLLALVLALGSCITVCAASLSSFKFPKDYSGDNYVLYSSNGRYYFSETDGTLFHSFSGSLNLKIHSEADVNASYLHTWVSDDMVSWKEHSQILSACLIINSYQVLKSNCYIYSADIYDNILKDDEHLFFPVPLARLAVPLKAEVLKQMKVILPAGVGCLALLTGSVVLLPRLRRSLLRL